MGKNCHKIELLPNLLFYLFYILPSSNLLFTYRIASTKIEIKVRTLHSGPKEPKVLLRSVVNPKSSLIDQMVEVTFPRDVPLDI